MDLAAFFSYNFVFALMSAILYANLFSEL